MLPQKKVNNETELLGYLAGVKENLQKLKLVCQTKNKTLKIKSFLNIVDIFYARADATHNYCRAGAYNETSVVVQKGIYDCVIEYLVNELRD